MREIGHTKAGPHKDLDRGILRMNYPPKKRLAYWERNPVTVTLKVGTVSGSNSIIASIS